MAFAIGSFVSPRGVMGYAVAAGGALFAGKAVYEVAKKYLDQSPINRPFSFVPSTISPEAQEYLRAATPVGGPVSDLEVWKLIRQGFRGATIEASNKAKAEHIDQINEIEINGVPVLEIIPKGYQQRDNEPVIFYPHGGAFTLGDPKDLLQVPGPVAHLAGMKVYAPKYRLAPENPFPAGLDDCLSVYKGLLDRHKSENIFFLGDSAGGNLCIATAFKARELNLPLPRAFGLYSPLVDVEKNSDTFYTLAGRSPKIDFEMSIEPSINVYAKASERQNPLVSVLNGDFSKFPPVMIHTGTRDLLLSECVRLANKIDKAGGESILKVWEGIWHGFQEHDIPEAKESAEVMANFFKKFAN